MEKRINAILIHKDDNVITTTEVLEALSVARYERDREIVEFIVAEEIPKFHKVALIDFQEAQPVCKYGQLIGETITPIRKGSHVHDHNIASPKSAV
ncbi:UxaA family hydrolase [Thermodesulfobacteriota bacterium]